MLDDQVVVGTFAARVHFVVAFVELGFGNFRHPRQVSQAFYEALGVVALLERTNFIACWKGQCHVRLDERRGE